MNINTVSAGGIFLAIISSIIAAPKQHAELLKCTNDQTCFSSDYNQTYLEVSKHIDTNVNPCDDFYAFACGGFIRDHPIPDDQLEVNGLNLITDLVSDQLHQGLEEPIVSNEPNAYKLVKKLYQSCMDTNAIEKEGLNTAKKLLKNLGGWPVLEGSTWNENGFDWKELMYKFRKYGFFTNYFLDMRIESNVKNSSQRIIVFDQATLPIDKLYLLDRFNSNIVEAFYDYILDLAVTFGADKNTATSELKNTFEFLFELAKITQSPENRRNITAMTNIMTIKELSQRFPFMNWIEYINNIIATPGIQVSNDDIVDVDVPQFVTDLESLLQKTPKRVQANYAISLIVSSLSSTLNKEVNALEFKFNKAVLGVVAVSPRWKDCLSSVAQNLKVATAALYARKYFDEDSKANIVQMVENIHDKFKKMLKNLDWMDSATKTEALAKANGIIPHIAYPQELLDDEKLDDYYENLSSSENYLQYVLNTAKFNADVTFKNLRKIIDKNNWIEHSISHAVNAYYNAAENSIILPAGILQRVMFNNKRPNYMNYAGIGFVVGHELTHGFDDAGRQISKNLVLENWWSDATAVAFENKAQCLIKEFSNFSSEKLKINLNGVITQGENIADNGGIKLAYEAYQAWVQQNGPEKCLPNLPYTPNQLFWIAFGNAWCANEKDESLRSTMLTSAHPPSMYRVLGVVRNSEYFARDFNCPSGSAMNPTDKCTFW